MSPNVQGWKRGRGGKATQWDDMDQEESKINVRATRVNVSRKSQSRIPQFGHKVKDENLTFHHKLPVISKCMVQFPKDIDPFTSPHLRAVRPCPRPFSITPRISDDDETLAETFFCAKHSVGMPWDQSLGFFLCSHATRKKAIFTRTK